MFYIKVCQHVTSPWGHPSSHKAQTSVAFLLRGKKWGKNSFLMLKPWIQVNRCWAVKHTSHWFSVLSHIWTHFIKPGEDAADTEASRRTLQLCNETVISVLQPTWLEAVNYKHDRTVTRALKVHLISWQRMGISHLQAVWHHNSGIQRGASLFRGKCSIRAHVEEPQLIIKVARTWPLIFYYIQLVIIKKKSHVICSFFCVFWHTHIMSTYTQALQEVGVELNEYMITCAAVL